MGLANTTTNLSYARNELIKVGESFIFDKVADMIWYMMTNDDISTTTTTTLTVGSDGTGHDVTFYSEAASSYFLWDESENQLSLVYAFMNMGTQGTGTALTTAKPFAVEIHAKPVSVLTAGATGLSAGIRCRYEVGEDQTNQISIEAIDARLRVKKDLADGVHCGICGTIEASESGTVLSGTATTQRSAGNFCLDFSADVSITSGWLTGVTIDSSVNGSVSMASCTFAGLRIKVASGKEPWEYGIYMDDCAIGILVNDVTDDAITIGGTFDHGIRFTEDPQAADNTNSFINIGDYGTAVAVAPTSQHMFGEMHNVSITDVNVSYYYQAKYTKITTSGTTTNTSIAGHALRMQVGSSLGAVYGIQCHTNITATNTCANEIASISTMIDLATGTVTTTDRVVALQALITGSGTAGTVTGLLHVAYFGNRGTQIDTDAIIFINNQSAAVSDVAIEFDLDGTVTNCFEFNGTVCDAYATGDGAVTQSNEYVKIPVTVEGITPQLYLLAAETWS